MNPYFERWVQKVPRNLSTQLCHSVVQLPLGTLPDSAIAPVLIVYIILALAATVINLLLIYIYLSNASLKKKRSTRLLISLSASGLCIGMIVGPICIALILKSPVPPCHLLNYTSQGTRQFFP